MKMQLRMEELLVKMIAKPKETNQYLAYVGSWF